MAHSPTRRPAGIRLLPSFDAYLIGCHPRDLVYPGPAADTALTRGQAGTVPVVLLHGAVAGILRQQRSGRALRITIELFRDLTSAQRSELTAGAERTGEILGLHTDVAYGSVGVGRHL